jgi:hypothetical protein
MRSFTCVVAGIGISLVCSSSYAGGPAVKNRAIGPVGPSYVRSHPSATAAARKTNVVPRKSVGPLAHPVDPRHRRHHDYHNPFPHKPGPHVHYRCRPWFVVPWYVAPTTSSGGYTDELERRTQLEHAISEALLNRQQAEAEAIRNQKEAAKAREEARQRYLSRQAERRAANQRKAAESRKPPKPTLPRLSAEQFDRQTGKISWPKALQGKTCESARRELDQLAAIRPDFDDSAEREKTDIAERIAEIKSHLRKQINEMPPSEYVAARRFLDGLANELRLMRTSNGLVADSRSYSD